VVSLGSKQVRGVRPDQLRDVEDPVEELIETTEEVENLAEDVTAMLVTGKPQKQNPEHTVELREVSVPQQVEAGERMELTVELNRNAPIQVRVGDVVCPRPMRTHTGCYRVDFTPQDPGVLMPCLKLTACLPICLSSRVCNDCDVPMGHCQKNESTAPAAHKPSLTCCARQVLYL